MIEIREKAACCGCAACANACPRKCIAMEPDGEGFLYPRVRVEDCIDCGLCERVCPILNQVEETPVEQDAYLVQHKDETVRAQSTSGGAFTALAQAALRRGGIVFGAAFDESLTVRHIGVEREEELVRFRGSKYVQSEIGGTFRQAKEQLDSGRTVLFSGTPCQIEGLHRFLRRPYDELLTVDVVCHAVPSPLVFQKYLAYRSANLGEEIGTVRFRDKSLYGYQYSQFTVTDRADRDVYHNGTDSDPFMRAFFSDICDRPSCYDCAFKKQYRISDFTLWDCFEPDRFDKAFDDNTGVTRVLIHTRKGRQFFDSCKEVLHCRQFDVDAMVRGSREMLHSVTRNPQREAFFQDVDILSEAALMETYFPLTAKVRLERLLRRFGIRTGLYRNMRRIYRRVLGKS